MPKPTNGSSSSSANNNNSKQVPTLELPEDAQPLAPALPYKAEGQLYKDLMDRIGDERGKLSLVSVVGVLELCKSYLIEMQD